MASMWKDESQTTYWSSMPWRANTICHAVIEPPTHQWHGGVAHNQLNRYHRAEGNTYLG